MQMSKLLASAAQAQGAAIDMIEAARDGEIRPIDNIGSGETLTCLVDGLRLLILAQHGKDDLSDLDTDTAALLKSLHEFLETRDLD